MNQIKDSFISGIILIEKFSIRLYKSYILLNIIFMLLILLLFNILYNDGILGIDGNLQLDGGITVDNPNESLFHHSKESFNVN